MLRAHRELLEADAWILGDGPVHQSRRMQVSFGVRGAFGLEMTTYGPSTGCRPPVSVGRYAVGRYAQGDDGPRV